MGASCCRCRYPQSGYDRAMEDQILSNYARAIAGVGGQTASLMVETTRSGLPPLEPVDVMFWEPQQVLAESPARNAESRLQEVSDVTQLNIGASDLESLLAAAMAAFPTSS